MFLLRRLLPFLVAASLFGTLWIFITLQKDNGSSSSWKQRIPETVGLGGSYGSGGGTTESVGEGSHSTHEEESAGGKVRFKEPKVDSLSPYPIGKTKPAGSNYTKCLVLPKLQIEDTTWVGEELKDMLDLGSLTTAIYTVDDPHATLHPPKNKGHEVMVYLSYIIDFYDNLADTNIFMHSHQKAWHNNELLDRDAAKMVRYLSDERVAREGYMNLRCHWDPGCPEWLHPGNTVWNEDKQEEVLLARFWTQVFPDEAVPKVLAQPCCAQFAVSGERIRALPRERYVAMREWLLGTGLEDYLSGRIFEYVWQYIFSKAAVHCPSMSACYCDGYGVCFGSAREFDKWFELRYDMYELEDQLVVWQDKADDIEVERQRVGDGRVAEDAMLDVPEFGKDRVLKGRIKEMQEELERRLKGAMELGRDPRQRAIESGREWSEGDGF